MAASPSPETAVSGLDRSCVDPTAVTDVVPSAAPPAPSGEPSSGNRRRWLLVLGGVGLALAGGYLAAYVLVGSGVPRGTTVAGVAIGGLQPAAASAVLDEQLADDGQVLTVSLDGSSRTVVAGEAGLSLDATATVEAAGARSANPVVLARQLFGQDVAPVVEVDEARLDRTLARLARRVDDAPRQGRVSYEGTTPVAVEPRAGRALDRPAAALLLRDAYLSADGPVELPLVTVAPQVTAEQVREVAEGLAVTAVSAPITLVVEDRGDVVVEPEALADSLVFVAADGRLVPRISTQRLRLDLGTALSGVERPAVDASFDVSSGRPVVVASSPGLAVPDDALAQGLVDAMGGVGDRTVSVELAPVQADLTTREARALGVTEVISSFTQYFPYAEYRVTNIGVAAEKMDGTVLEPGETFSLNGVVGERTPENGFVKGYIIVGNRLVEDYGGAVSTITTATWDAAFFGGMTRVEQRAHGFWISRYKPGLEATVSWGNLDLKWRNDTPYGVLVTTAMTDESVTVTLWSTKYWDIEAEFGPRTNPRPAGRVYDDGPDCVAQVGVDGFDITVTRVWSRDGEVKRREPLRTSYSSAPTVVCGTDPALEPSDRPTDKPSDKPSDEPTDG